MTEGVHFGALVAALSPDTAAVEEMLHSLLETATEPALIDAVAEENSSFSEQSVHFADLVIAAVRGDALARRSLDETLPGLSRYEETAALARWVTRTLARAGPAEDLTGTRIRTASP